MRTGRRAGVCRSFHRADVAANHRGHVAGAEVFLAHKDPTDQIIFADDAGGCARVGFGGMRFAGLEEGRLIFFRVRDLHPEEQLSPARSHTMTLEPHWVSSILVDGRLVWPSGSSSSQ